VGETAIFKEFAITAVSPFIHVRSRACAISPGFPITFRPSNNIFSALWWWAVRTWG